MTSWMEVRENSTFQNLCKFIGERIGQNPICIETGCVYVDTTDNRPHGSTFNIVDYIAAPNNGILYSYDNRQSSFDAAIKGLDNNSVYFRPVLGDSVEQLRTNYNNYKSRNIKFAFLDSVEGDEEHMLNEFKIIEPYLSEDAIVLLDDVLNPSSVKWKKTVPYVRSNVQFWDIIPTGGGVIGCFVGFYNKNKYGLN